MWKQVYSRVGVDKEGLSGYSKHTYFSPYYYLTHTVSLASHLWDIGKQCRPNAASDQGLHCLLTGISIRNKIKMKKYTRHT